MLTTFFNRLSVQSKLLVLVLVASLLSFLLTGLVSYTSSRDALMQAGEKQLTALRNDRAQAITSYFDMLQNHALTLSEASMVVNALKEFKQALNPLNETKLTAAQIKRLRDFYDNDFIPKLKQNVGGNPTTATYFPSSPVSQYLKYYYIGANPYPAAPAKLDDPKDGSEYSKIHKNYHFRFRNIIKLFEYSDILLIDIETAEVLYSVNKEVDFGTNLTTGSQSDSALAQAFQVVKKSKDPNFVTVIDFEPYKPSFGKPVTFVATTVFDGDQFIGALVLKLNVDRIDQVMSANENWEHVGMGKTGETFLVGQDHLLRSTHRLFLENPDAYYQVLRKKGVPEDEINLIKSSGSPILITELKTAAVEKALNRETGIIPYTDYRGVPVLGAYQPIKLGGFKWGLVAKMDRAELFEGVDTLTKRLLGLAAILMPVITMVSIALARSFLNPIRKLISGTHAIATGKTDVQVKVSAEDEFGELAASFNTMSKTLYEKELAIEAQIRENDRLLLTILPPKAAARLKSGEQDIVESFPNVTVLFAELEGFNRLLSETSSQQVIVLLNEIVGAFDEAAERYGVEKLRSIGATYLAVCGLSVPRVDHTKRTVDFALELLNIIRRFSHKHNISLSLDIGIHAGPVAAGVIGKTKFNYDIWGDTMNIARVIHVSPGQNVIQVTESVFNALSGLYRFQQVQDIYVKGHGKLPIWEVMSLVPSETATTTEEG